MPMKSVEKLRLLIVDDEQDISDLLREELSILQCGIVPEIETANNGRVALEKVEKEWFDAVLSDINMPLLTGLEFLSELRKLGKRTPVVFLTGFGSKSNAVEALRLGAFDFLDKPWNVEKLHAVVAEAIQVGRELRSFEDKMQELLSKYPDLSDNLKKQIPNAYEPLLVSKLAQKVKKSS